VRGSRKRLPNALDHSSSPDICGEPKHYKAVSPECRISLQIPHAVVCFVMERTINLNDQAGIKADKIYDIPLDRNLAAELPTIEPPIA
jgi:hypothetical protein